MKWPKVTPGLIEKAEGWLEIVLRLAWLVVCGAMLCLWGFVAALFWETELLLLRILAVAVMLVAVILIIIQILELIKAIWKHFKN